MLVVHGNGEHDLQSRTVRRTRQPSRAAAKPAKTLEDLALQAQRVVARKIWWINEVKLARRATHAWGRLQKEMAAHMLTTSQQNSAISTRSTSLCQQASDTAMPRPMEVLFMGEMIIRVPHNPQTI